MGDRDATGVYADEKGNLLCIGDAVTWTSVTRNGSSISFASREGKVYGFTDTDSDGAYARIKLRNGKFKSVPVRHLRRSDVRRALTDAVIGGQQ